MWFVANAEDNGTVLSILLGTISVNLAISCREITLYSKQFDVDPMLCWNNKSTRFQVNVYLSEFCIYV